MASVNDRTASIWHAINTLDCQQKGVIQKSQLKVLSHNLGTSLGIENLHKSLDDYGSGEALTFQDYMYFLRKELFEPLEESVTMVTAGSPSFSLDKIDEVCWMICCKSYIDRENKHDKVISDDDVYKLWRVFNILAEINENKLVKIPVVMDQEEVVMLHQKFLSYLGSSLHYDNNKSELNQQNISAQEFSFQQFLQVIEYGSQMEPTMTSVAIADLYEEYVQEVLRKGNLHKKGHRMANWKERFFVLTPQSLCYYSGQDMKEKKGEVKISRQCHVDILPAAKHYRFQVSGDGKTCEITAPDERTRSQWIVAMKKAIDCSSQLQSPQKQAGNQRRQQRALRRKREEEEQDRRHRENQNMVQQLEHEKRAREESEAKRHELEAKYKEQEALNQAEQVARVSMEKGRSELEAQFKYLASLVEAEKKARTDIEEQYAKQAALTVAEKQARAEAVAKWSSEQALREQERRRLEELQEGYRQLEEMLDQERQLKRDEEIVRNLQARILQEEFEKSEQLERLRGELEVNLQEERQRREGLEDWKTQQQERMDQEMQQLQKLQADREQMDTQLQMAQLRIQDTEQERDNLQERLKEKERMTPMQRLGQMILPAPSPLPSHRGVGFFPQYERGMSQDSSRANSTDREVDLTAPPLNNNNDEKCLNDDDIESTASHANTSDSAAENELFNTVAER